MELCRINQTIIIVDSVAIASVADATRPLTAGTTGQDGYKVEFINLDGDAKFTVSDVAVYSLGVIAQGGETEYADMNAAFEAAAGATVTLIDNLVIGDITVPAGVTLDLNGKSVKADNVVSYGDVINSDANASASIGVTGALVLDKNNAQLPVYHNVNKCYYFGVGEVARIGVRGSSNDITFGFGPQFENAYLYHLMSKPAVEGSDADCGLNVQITLDWTGNEDDALVFEMSEELIRKYGDMAYTYNASGLVAAMMLHVSGIDGLEIGSNVIVDVTVTSDTGVVMTGETMYYEIAG